MPDSETTVLIATINADEPVWIGWFDSEHNTWRDVSAEPIEVSHWMHLPDPPKP